MKIKILTYCVVVLATYAVCLTYYVFHYSSSYYTYTSTDRSEEVKKTMELEQKIIRFGDTNAYNFLIENYGSTNNLIYSIYMADQFGYPKACHYVYDEIAGILYGYNGIAPDSIVTNLTLSCLYRGKEDPDCSMELGMLFTTGYMVEKDTIKGRYYTEMAFRDEGEEYVDRLMKMYLTNKMFDLPHR